MTRRTNDVPVVPRALMRMPDTAPVTDTPGASDRLSWALNCPRSESSCVPMSSWPWPVASSSARLMRYEPSVALVAEDSETAYRKAILDLIRPGKI